ncbi:MAG: HAD hydrolase family protein [Eubacteriales bacterium]
MNLYDNIILVSDFDGTFYTRYTEGLNRNIEAIEKFKSMGGLFTLATGRTDSTLTQLFPRISTLVNAPCIMGNGTYLYDYPTGKRILDLFLESESVMRLLTLVHSEYPEIGIRITRSDNSFLTPRINESVKMDIGGEVNVTIHEKPIEHFNDEDKYGWNKIVLSSHGSGEVLDEVRARCCGCDVSDINFMRSWSTLLEITPQNGTKGHMLTELKKITGRPDAIIVAVGDYENDENMLKLADIAAAPANATPQIKAIASIHACGCDEGAIADVINILKDYKFGK